MIHVIRHYVPLRKAILIGSETVLLTLVLGMAMSNHLWGKLSGPILHNLARLGIGPEEGLTRCWTSALVLACLAQVAIGFNELYDFRISNSRYDRAARFLGSAGSALVLLLGTVTLVRLSKLEPLLDFPGLPFTHRLQLLTTGLVLGFGLLYVWRNLFHYLQRRWNFDERILVLGSGKFAHALASELEGRGDSGYEAVGIVSGLDWVQGKHENPASERFLGQSRRASDREPKASNQVSERPDSHADEEAPFALTGSGDAAAPEVSERRAFSLAYQRRDGDLPEVSTLILEHPIVRTGNSDKSAADTETGDSDSAPKPELETLNQSLSSLVRSRRVNSVVVALENRRGVLPTDELLRCRLAGVVVEEGEALYERVTGKIATEAMRPSYLIFNRGFIQHPAAALLKRCGDFVLALVGILLTWPLMIATAIAVRLDSPGSILFRQERTGRNNKPFTMLKFRSMRADAEKGSGPVWAQANDPRITRVGNFLRKSRLDELPQLFNVLVGDMSIVGPRPERPHFVRELSEQIPYYGQRHIVKPGLTGWAQINYPYGNTIEDSIQKLQYDLFYIKYQSFLFDISIAFNTIKTVILRKGT